MRNSSGPRRLHMLLVALAACVLGVAGFAFADTITGTGGPDTITGTQFADDISGNGGNDEISALCGNDLVKGGLGSDTVDGNGNVASFVCPASTTDDDTVHGGAARDKVIDRYGPATGGAADSDHLTGGVQGDTLNGNDGDGKDLIDGGPGTDTCFGDFGDTFQGCEVINP